jgi:hypothetical protein
MSDIDKIMIQSEDVEPVAGGVGFDFTGTTGIKSILCLTAGNIEYTSENNLTKVFLGLAGVTYQIRGKIILTTNTTSDVLVYLREA